MYRIGIGYDVHRLVENRNLVLGGVDIPYTLGLAGHSDADVLIHAVCDAILGAFGEKDIGHLFPDTDKKYKNIASTRLLKEVSKRMHDRGYEINNLDCIIIAQRPRCNRYIPKMRKIIAGVLQTAASAVSVKATTTEKLGFAGRGEGIAAEAVVLLRKTE